MKKLWLVLLSLGLVMAFSVSAFAVDIKVGADFYVGGLYLNKTNVSAGHPTQEESYPSTAFFYQRLRVGTDFIVSPSLKLVTRFDAMERIWGGPRSNTWAVNQDDYYAMSAETQFENENIAVDVVYIDYTSPIGKFQVGYMPDLDWGTVFGNYTIDDTLGQIKWSNSVGPVILMIDYAKFADHSSSSVTQNSWWWYDNVMAQKTDRDSDVYSAGVIYPFKSSKANGEAGILMRYFRDASNRGDWAGPYLSRAYIVEPYAKATIGPVALEAEVNYTWGDAAIGEYGGKNVRLDSLSAYVNADAKFGMVRVGGTFAYLQGDDNGDDDVIHDASTGGVDYNPCLLMFNYDTVNYWIGGLASNHEGQQVGGPMTNAWFLQGRVGVNPTPQLDLLASFSWAQADKKPYAGYGGPYNQYASGDYGWEIDVTGTYKITNNLSYMLGAGYLFTGNYFKPDADAYPFPGEFEKQDDFIIINKLTLSF